MQSLYELEPLEELDEQEQFLSILYHDSQGGNAIRMLLGEEAGDKTYIRHFANRDYRKIGYRATNYNAYTSINTFRSYKRVADDVFNYSGIFIDLDGHDFSTEEKLNKAIERTKEKLKHLYETEQITPPTMITYTGRGLGLFYVLSRSIANIPKNRKSIKLLDDVKVALTAKYRKLLSERGLLQVDETVKDAARVCRLPLTLNKKCNRWCRLIHISYTEEDEIRYCDLKQLAEENHLFDEINEVRRTLRSAKVVSLDAYRLPFLTIRLQKIEKLQELREYDCQGYREYMAFIYYNAAKQIHGTRAAETLTMNFNSRFKQPLGIEELGHIKSVVDGNVSPTKDYEGFYKLPDRWIIESLNISTEENKVCRFGASKRQIEREQIKEEHARAKSSRNAQILEYIKENAKQTYKDIAAYFGVSESTVRRIAKNNGVQRYKVSEVVEPAPKVENLESVQIVQNLSESLLGVPFSLSESVIITPASDSILRSYVELYADVREKRQRKRQIPGQLCFRMGPDGGLNYFECS